MVDLLNFNSDLDLKRYIYANYDLTIYCDHLNSLKTSSYESPEQFHIDCFRKIELCFDSNTPKFMCGCPLKKLNEPRIFHPNYCISYDYKLVRMWNYLPMYMYTTVTDNTSFF